MFSFVYLNLKKGIKKITDNPQLIYTIVVAIIITGSFIFMSERFISIANNAQERLINVRIGSLQDAFVSFASDKVDDSLYLNNRINDMVASNETITDFNVIKKETILDEKTNQNIISYRIFASNKIEEIGKDDNKASFLYTLASGDPTHSITIAVLDSSNNRLFKTTRAITDQTGNVLGVVMTTQSLSQADLAIENSIKNSRILLFIVIAFVMLLFLRHSKIIDYMDLYKKLKEVNQMKDDFISMASHELRTPLSIIRGYAEFAREAPELTAETKDYMLKIDSSTKELDSLVSDMLDVSKIQQGRMSFEIVKTDVTKLIEQIVTSFELPAKEKGLTVSFDKSKLEINQFINIDINRFKQIMVNLVGNAIKYTKAGEVVVREYVENKRLYFRVSDTGIGMSEEEKKKLFEKFYRIRNKDTEDIRGTGLGLWITVQIIEQMGGDISVESIKGVGSHFIVSFPLVS